MPSLDEEFDALVARLNAPGSVMGASGDPFYYFAYPPEETMEVKRRLPVWIGRLRNEGFTVERVSFADLLWELIDASGRWELWLEAEAEAEPDQVNQAIADVLNQGDALVERVGAVVGQAGPRRVVLLTETEVLHPYFRARAIEHRLHDRVKAPTVVFYPGRRFGQYGLGFLGLYQEDSNYRATIIGGLP